MDRIDFTQPGGFPLTQDTFDYLQSAFRLVFTGIARSFGDKVILWGCEQNASGSVSSGWVIVNGEVLYTPGGSASTVYISQEATPVRFADNTLKDVYWKRVLRFGMGSPQYNWLEFRRLKTVAELTNTVFPAGGIVMWSGAPTNIPAGWALCNGENGTPDLRGRFVVGYNPSSTPGIDYTAVGKVGGQDLVLLTEEHIPPHDHEFSVGFRGSESGHDRSHVCRVGDVPDGQTDWPGYGVDSNGWVTRKTKKSAPTWPLLENRPAYYVVAYIMKIL